MQRSTCLLLAAFLVGPQALESQGGPPPQVTSAQALLQRGQADSAIAVLEGFFAQSPTAVAGRLLLGNAYLQKGDLDRALETYTGITAPRPVRLQARFNAARIYARRGNRDEAFRLLAELKASGAFDMDLTGSTPDFASLKSDPRFDSVQFHPAEFEHPFVEPVRVIHEWVAEHKGDQFSWIARGIGDVDGDRASDIVTSAPTYGAAGQPIGPGRVYLYSGRSGKLLWTFTGQGTEQVGTGLEGAGDVNRDGTPDVIAGAPGAQKAYVLSGKDGAVLLALSAADSGGSFGQATASAGDQNGDGYADLLVGAPAAQAGAGRAYLFSGRDGTLLQVLSGEKAGDAFGSIVAGMRTGTRTPFTIGAPGAGPRGTGRVYVYPGAQQAPRFVIDSDSSGAALGAMFTSIVGDVNGDRVPDVYAADFSDGGRGPGAGRVYVRSGRDGRELLTLSGEQPGDGFGIGSAEAGDVNSDGHDDLVVGAWQYAGAAQSGGKVYVYSGKDGTLLREITGRVPGETFGFDATGVGDVDGDGVVDLLLTSTWSNIKGFRTGRMFVISGK